MTDAEAQFAARLADELERDVGPAMTVDDVELEVGDGTARVVATLRLGTEVETIEAVGNDVLSLYQPIMRQAAETRLASSFRRLLTMEER
jgi:hypothetical protein